MIGYLLVHENKNNFLNHASKNIVYRSKTNDKKARKLHESPNLPLTCVTFSTDYEY